MLTITWTCTECGAVVAGGYYNTASARGFRETKEDIREHLLPYLRMSCTSAHREITLSDHRPGCSYGRKAKEGGAA